ncbi:MAG: hypothetical protein ABII23_00670, partial [bacterium]
LEKSPVYVGKRNARAKAIVKDIVGRRNPEAVEGLKELLAIYEERTNRNKKEYKQAAAEVKTAIESLAASRRDAIAQTELVGDQTNAVSRESVRFLLINKFIAREELNKIMQDPGYIEYPVKDVIGMYFYDGLLMREIKNRLKDTATGDQMYPSKEAVSFAINRWLQGLAAHQQVIDRAEQVKNAADRYMPDAEDLKKYFKEFGIPLPIKPAHSQLIQKAARFVRTVVFVKDAKVVLSRFMDVRHWAAFKNPALRWRWQALLDQMDAIIDAETGDHVHIYPAQSHMSDDPQEFVSYSCVRFLLENGFLVRRDWENLSTDPVFASDRKFQALKKYYFDGQSVAYIVKWLNRTMQGFSIQNEEEWNDLLGVYTAKIGQHECIRNKRIFVINAAESYLPAQDKSRELFIAVNGLLPDGRPVYKSDFASAIGREDIFVTHRNRMCIPIVRNILNGEIEKAGQGLIEIKDTYQQDHTQSPKDKHILTKEIGAAIQEVKKLSLLKQREEDIPKGPPLNRNFPEIAVNENEVSEAPAVPGAVSQTPPPAEPEMSAEELQASCSAIDRLLSGLKTTIYSISDEHVPDLPDWETADAQIALLPEAHRTEYQVKRNQLFEKRMRLFTEVAAQLQAAGDRRDLNIVKKIIKICGGPVQKKLRDMIRARERELAEQEEKPPSVASPRPAQQSM